MPRTYNGIIWLNRFSPIITYPPLNTSILWRAPDPTSSRSAIRPQTPNLLLPPQPRRPPVLPPTFHSVRLEYIPFIFRWINIVLKSYNQIKNKQVFFYKNQIQSNFSFGNINLKGIIQKIFIMPSFNPILISKSQYKHSLSFQNI